MSKELYDPDRAEAAAELWSKLASFEGEDADAQLIIERAMSEYACTADKRIEDSEWAQKYKAACIKIAELYEALEKIADPQPMMSITELASKRRRIAEEAIAAIST